MQPSPSGLPVVNQSVSQEGRISDVEVRAQQDKHKLGDDPVNQSGHEIQSAAVTLY